MKTLNIILSAFSAALGIRMLPFFMTCIKPDWLAMVISCLSGAVAFGLAQAIAKIPMQFPQFRRYVAQVYGIEGYWFELVEGEKEHLFSFAWIRYNPQKNVFRYKGTNFNRDFTVNARWATQAVVIGEDTDKIAFLFEATVIQGSEKIHGCGSLEFSDYMSRKYASASGYFIDSGSKLEKRTLSAERISGAFVRKAIGRHKPQNEEDIRKILEFKVSERGGISKF